MELNRSLIVALSLATIVLVLGKACDELFTDESKVFSLNR